MINVEKLIRSRVFQKLVKGVPDKKYNIKIRVEARPATNCVYLTCRIVETQTLSSFYVGFSGQEVSPHLTANIFNDLFLRDYFGQRTLIL
jgi:hypothetical protein